MLVNNMEYYVIGLQHGREQCKERNRNINIEEIKIDVIKKN